MSVWNTTFFWFAESSRVVTLNVSKPPYWRNSTSRPWSPLEKPPNEVILSPCVRVPAKGFAAIRPSAWSLPHGGRSRQEGVQTLR